MICENKFPTIPSKYKIALIGEAPGADEERAGQPFVGYSGRFLAQLLTRAGVGRDSCFFGNISQHRPPGNEIHRYDWNGPQIQLGLERLTADLERFQPNICVLLGNVPLKAAKDCYSSHPLVPGKFRFPVAFWRGSVFAGDEGPFAGRKCLPSFHPAYVVRDYEQAPFLQLDLRKAVVQSTFRELKLIARNVEVCDTLTRVLTRLLQLRWAKKLVAVDLEGYVNLITCIGFGLSPSEAFVVPLKHKDGSPYWQPHEITQIWRALAQTLEDPEVPKTFQYGLYDTFVLHYGHGIRVKNYLNDTIHKHWEIYSEFAKADDNRKATGKRGMGLAIQASIWTDMPYYKSDRKAEDDATHYRYCGTDCLVTKEVDEVTGVVLNSESVQGGFRPAELEIMRDHYRFNSELLPAFRYISMRGIRYDSALAAQRCEILKTKIYEAQAKVNALCGCGFRGKSGREIYEVGASQMLTKKRDRPLKDEIWNWERFKQLVGKPPTLASIGEIENLCGVSLNIDSAKQFNEWLYTIAKLPPQYNDNKDDPGLTSDYEALLHLSKYCQEHKRPEFAVIQLAIEIRALATRIENLSVECEPDGRMRFSFNITGTNTGRTQAGKCATGRGRAGQGVPKYAEIKDAPGGILGDRDLFRANDGFHFWQCDLKGADGWTVAAYSAMLGDPTMLNDYLAGLKPARILALMLKGLPVSHDRLELKEQCKVIDDDDWSYFACKRVQHGCSYLEGGITVARNILTDSEGKLWMSGKECEHLKEKCFFNRYPGIRKWHNWVAGQISQRPFLRAASGQVRQFFGRPDEILTKAVAFEPQANTTYATNLAMRALWRDPENRTNAVPHQLGVAGHLVYERPLPFHIEPLHQVHDALCGQFRIERTAWAVDKIKSYFNNKLLIAGMELVIPFDGKYGRNWQMDKQSTVGSI